MIFYSSARLLVELNELYQNNIMIGNYFFTHGTFSSKSVNIITDIDIIDYLEIPTNNAINNLKINELKSNDILTRIQNKIKKISKHKNIFFDKLLSGFDDRFLFNFDLTENCEIINYNVRTIKLRFKKLLKNKVLKKKEYNILLNKVKKNPSITEFYDLVNHLEKYYQLTWTEKQILTGHKVIRKKQFNLIDTFQNYDDQFILSRNPIIFNYVVLKDNMYFNLESTLIFCYLKDDFYIIKDKEIKSKNLILDKYELLNEYNISQNHQLIKGLCKNLPLKKYFKMFKRLRSLLTIKCFNENNCNKTFDIIRKEMTDLLHQKYNILSQLKSRCHSLSKLKSKVTTSTFDALFSELLSDINESFKDRKNILNFNRKNIVNYKIKDLHKLEIVISNYLNNITKFIFLSFYNRTKKLLKLNISELENLIFERKVSFDDPLLCRSYIISNIRPNKKYKFFKSFFQYALDWRQCVELIPMENEVIKNTLMYMFNKFKSGLFIEIKNNKVERFVPFFNLEFKNNWSHLIDTNKIIVEKGVSKQITKW